MAHEEGKKVGKNTKNVDEEEGLGRLLIKK